MTLNVHFQEQQEGIGLLELMLSIAVIAMMLIVATRYYANAHMGQEVNEAVGIVQALTGAAAQWEAGQGSYAGITLTELNDYGLIPQDIWGTSGSSATGGSTGNPWGGDVTISAGGSGTNGGSNAQYTIKMDNVPLAGCENLMGKLQTQVSATANQSCTPDSGSNNTPVVYSITLP